MVITILAGLSSTSSSSTGASDLSFFFASASSSLSAARVRLDLGFAEPDAASGSADAFARDLEALEEAGLLASAAAVDFFLGGMMNARRRHAS
jgi:hypothetical protein